MHQASSRYGSRRVAMAFPALNRPQPIRLVKSPARPRAGPTFSLTGGNGSVYFRIRNRDLILPINEDTPMTDSGSLIAAASQPPRLLDQFRNAARAAGNPETWIDSLTSWVTAFIIFHGQRHPRELDAAARPCLSSSRHRPARRRRIPSALGGGALRWPVGEKTCSGGLLHNPVND